MKRWIAIWAGISALLVLGLLGRLEAIKRLVNDAGETLAARDGDGLYRSLIDIDLLRRTGDTLTLAPADVELAEIAEAQRRGMAPPAQDAAWWRRHELLQAVYGGRDGDGRDVLRQVALWSASRGFVAVRDNRGGPPAAMPLLPGDRPNQWQVEDGWQRPVKVAATPVPVAFAFAGGKRPRGGMGDWRAVLAPAGEVLALTSEITLADLASVHIEVIGRLLPAESLALNKAVVEWRCRTAPCSEANAEAASITFPNLSPGRHRIRLKVKPVSSQGVAVPGLKLMDAALQSASGAMLASAPPEWRSERPVLVRRAQVDDSSATIQTADGIVLWENGRPTQKAAALGLLPVVGVDSGHWAFLGGQIERARVKHGRVTVTLTINSRAQSAAQQALQETIAAKFGNRADDAPFRDQRRAAIIVLSPDDGAVLAVAQYPPVSDGLSVWDHANLAMGDPDRDDLAPRGWAAIGSASVPGSVFKIVVDLAALQQASERPEIAAMVSGCAPDARGWLSCLGMPKTQERYRARGQTCLKGKACGMGNFPLAEGRLENFADSLKTPYRSALCHGGPVASTPKIDMAIAIRDSSNVYHSHLAVTMDRQIADKYDRLAERRREMRPELLPDLDVRRSALLSTAAMLGLFDRDLDLAGPARAWLGGVGFDRLRAEPARSDLMMLGDPTAKAQRSGGAIDTLLQSAVGQQITVSPLSMARVAAVVRSNRLLPQPHLIAAWNDQTVATESGKRLSFDIEPVRLGMKLVPETGTAHEAHGGEDPPAVSRLAAVDTLAARLRAARCHLSGKTGSSDIPKRQGSPKATTGWYIGFAEPQAFAVLGEGSPSWSAPVAWACVITHVHGSKSRTGGTTCAPAIATMLDIMARPENSSGNSF